MAVAARIAALLGLLVLSAAGVSSASASVGRPRPPVMERIEAAPRVPAGARPARCRRRRWSPAPWCSSPGTTPRWYGSSRRRRTRTRRCSTGTCRQAPSRAGSARPGRRSAPSRPAEGRRPARAPGVERRPAGPLPRHRRAGRGGLPHRAGELPAARRLHPPRGDLGVPLPPSIAGSVAAVLGLDDLVQAQPVGSCAHPPRTAERSARPRRRASATRPARPRPARPPPRRPPVSAASLTTRSPTPTARSGCTAAATSARASTSPSTSSSRSCARTSRRSTPATSAPRAAGEHAQAAARDPGRRRPAAGPGSGEAILDVEDVSAIAPEATIDVYEGPAPAPTAPTTTRSTTTRRSSTPTSDQVVSTSWGLCEQAIQLGQPGLQAGREPAVRAGRRAGPVGLRRGRRQRLRRLQHLRDLDPGPRPEPALGRRPGQPAVRGVGRRHDDRRRATQPPAEHVWNDGADGGAGGGGISQSWTMPSWQREATVPGIALPGSADYTNADSVEKKLRLPAGLLPGDCRRRDGRRRRAAWSPTCRRRPTSSPARSPSIRRPSAAGAPSAAPPPRRRSGRRCWPWSTPRRPAPPTRPRAAGSVS